MAWLKTHEKKIPFMKSLGFKAEILGMVLVVPLTFFITSGLIGDDKALDLNRFVVCMISVTLGILLGAAFAKYVLVTLRNIRFYPFVCWLLSLAAGILSGAIVLVFVNPVVSVIGDTEITIGFFISAWFLSLKSPANKDGQGA